MPSWALLALTLTPAVLILLNAKMPEGPETVEMLSSLIVLRG